MVTTCSFRAPAPEVHKHRLEHRHRRQLLSARDLLTEYVRDGQALAAVGDVTALSTSQ